MSKAAKSVPAKRKPRKVAKRPSGARWNFADNLAGAVAAVPQDFIALNNPIAIVGSQLKVNPGGGNYVCFVKLAPNNNNPNNSVVQVPVKADEYRQLIAEPQRNREIRERLHFLLLYRSPMVRCHVLQWSQIKDNKLTTTIIQRKTGKPVEMTLHHIPQKILDIRREKIRLTPEECDRQKPRPIFSLPTANGANKAVRKWVKRTGINKDITWSCVRLSFSIILQSTNTDAATVALLLGHTRDTICNETYKRHRPKDQSATIAKLPPAEWYYN